MALRLIGFLMILGMLGASGYVAVADKLSYCLEFEKTHTFFLTGPGGTVAAGTC